MMALDAPSTSTANSDENHPSQDSDQFALGKLSNGDEVAYLPKDQVPDELLPHGSNGHGSVQQIHSLTVVPGDIGGSGERL